MNHRPWINFKELRARLKFEEVLAHYNVAVTRKGDQHLGPCPLPAHPRDKPGKTFSANLSRGIFQCFACKAKGNLLDFAGLMAGVDVEDGAALRVVAVELQEKFCPEGASRKNRPAPETAPKKEEPEVATNAPLDFHLKDLDYAHASLRSLGFEAAVMDHFEAGFCSRGSLKGSVAAALHSPEGKLVGYAKGDVVNMALRFSYPESRERHGVRHEFDPGQLIYNAHRIETSDEDLFVVDSLSSVWWLHQNGRPRTAAILGDEASESQATLLASLVAPSGRIWLTPSADERGERLATSLLSHLAALRFVRWMRLETGMTPTDLTKREMETCFPQ